MESAFNIRWMFFSKGNRLGKEPFQNVGIHSPDRQTQKRLFVIFQVKSLLYHPCLGGIENAVFKTKRNF